MIYRFLHQLLDKNRQLNDFAALKTDIRAIEILIQS